MLAVAPHKAAGPIDRVILKRVIRAAIVPALSVALLVPASGTVAGAIPPPPPCLAGMTRHQLCVAVYRYGNTPWRMVIAGPAAKYFSRYQLCVQRYLGGHRECHRFRMPRPRFGHFESRIRWSAHFTDTGPGRYVARWFALPADRLVRTPQRFTEP